MLGFEAVECSVVSAPHQVTERFHPTEVHRSPDTLSITVAYGMMVLQVIIYPGLIGEFLGFGVHISIYKRHEAGSGGLRH